MKNLGLPCKQRGKKFGGQPAKNEHLKMVDKEMCYLIISNNLDKYML